MVAYKRAMDVCRKIVAVVLLLMGSCALAQNPDFVWDWRNQQIIGRNDPSLGNTSRLTEPERSELIDAVVLRLQKPMSDAGYDDDRIREIATTTRVRFVDVGEPHPLLVTTSMGLEGGCDSLGNCPLWVFRRSSDGFVSLLNAIAASYTMQSGESAPQLVLMRHVSQQESALMAYRFAEGKLTATACYKALWPPQSSDNTQPSDPKLVACDDQPKWEAAPADVKPGAPAEQSKQEAAPAAAESKPDVQSPEPKAGQQQPAPEQPAPGDKQAAPNPDQAQPQQPAPDSKPDQQQAAPEQPAPSDKQAAPNPDQAQPQPPAPESKPDQQQAAPEQPAPSDNQAAPNPDQTQPQQSAPESKPDDAPKPDSTQPNPQQI